MVKFCLENSGMFDFCDVYLERWETFHSFA